MIRIALLLAASSALSVTLTGCTGHTATQPQPETVAAAIQSGHAVPVFIIPNCKVLAGNQYCQWIEPRGYQHASEPVQTSARINGIAL